jgi:NADH:ubiquinone oxidoreductase subunit C
MSTEELLNQAAALLESWTENSNAPEPNRLDVFLDVAHLIPAVSALQEAGWGYLATITGLDLGEDENAFEVMYHFCEVAAVLTLRMRIPREDAHVPSLIDVIPSVSFYERELMEMFGITVDGTPNTDHLFLPEDWPDGVYPLRKDFDIRSITAQS